MTYKKKYKYKKSLKKKKRRGGSDTKLSTAIRSLTGNGTTQLNEAVIKIEKTATTLASGEKDALHGTGGGPQAALGKFSGVASTALSGDVGKGAKKAVAEAMADPAKALSNLKSKKPDSMFKLINKIMLKQATKTSFNFSLFLHTFKSPTLKENKYMEQIEELKKEDKENFKYACKLIYLYYPDEYATKYSYMIDNPQDMSYLCHVFYVINQQILLYKSSHVKKLIHFKEIFVNNNKFRELYEKAEGINCDKMREFIQELFKIDEKHNYSYIILYLLFDLLAQKYGLFIEIMDELKQAKKEKKCSIFDDSKNILGNCKEKNNYDQKMTILELLP